MGKSAEAFRTISEVETEIEVPKHVLRFWEGKFTQVKPMKRGGGRRYYRPEDVELLRGIRNLLYDDRYTIKGVQKILRENGIEFVKGCGRGEDMVPAPNRTKSDADIPDLAGETAHNAARPRAKLATGHTRERATVSEANRTKSKTKTVTLDKRDKLVLHAVLKDLESCKELLMRAAQ